VHGGALAGCWFTLVALAGEPAECKRVQQQIRQNGGRFFDDGRAKLLLDKGSREAAFAICPFGFPLDRQATARRHADFRLGAPCPAPANSGLGRA